MKRLAFTIIMLFSGLFPSLNNQIKAQSGSPFPFVEEGGNVIFEAENYHEIVTGSNGDAWQFLAAPAGFSGRGAMQGLPDNGGSSRVEDNPYLEFRIQINTPANYYLYTRQNGMNNRADSVYFSVDGSAQQQLNSYRSPRGSYGWTRGRNTVFLAAGEHVVRITLREDGTIIDKVALSVFPDYLDGEELGDEESQPLATATPTATSTPAATATPLATPTPAATATPAYAIYDVELPSGNNARVEMRTTAGDIMATLATAALTAVMLFDILRRMAKGGPL